MYSHFKTIFYIPGILIAYSLFIIQGCKFGDCGECFSPPFDFTFEILDHVTGENLFSNGRYNPDSISVQNMDDNSLIPFDFVSESDLLVINSIGWKTETVNYIFIVGSDSLFSLHVEAERASEDCCTFTRYHEIIIENSSFEFVAHSGIYNILVD